MERKLITLCYIVKGEVTKRLDKIILPIVIKELQFHLNQSDEERRLCVTVLNHLIIEMKEKCIPQILELISHLKLAMEQLEQFGYITFISNYRLIINRNKFEKEMAPKLPIRFSFVEYLKNDGEKVGVQETISDKIELYTMNQQIRSEIISSLITILSMMREEHFENSVNILCI